MYPLFHYPDTSCIKFVLVSKEFLVLVGMAILLAIPLTWWGMHHWLQDFAYRVDMGWWIFAGTGLVAIAIAVLTVGYQALNAAVVNPIKSLRAE